MMITGNNPVKASHGEDARTSETDILISWSRGCRAGNSAAIALREGQMPPLGGAAPVAHSRDAIGISGEIRAICRDE